MLSFCIPFYRNQGMLAHQFKVWREYRDEVKAQIEVVLVDDGSPEPAMDVPRPGGLPKLRVYRVLKDIPWHQHGARNLAATEAEGPWLFLTDMDHVIPNNSLQALLELLKSASPDAVHTFHRLDAPHMKPTLDGRGNLKPHCNTFAMSKAKFWMVGGYDEDCVGYGTDSYWRRRLYAHGPAIHLDQIPIVRYPREVIADASTRGPEGMDPKAFRGSGRRRTETNLRMEAKRLSGEGPKVLAFPWERVL